MSREPGAEVLDDAVLLARIQERDRAAFEDLVLRKRDRAFRLARRVVGQDEDARDVVQLAFLRVWRKARGFRPGSDFDPWFHRIVMNLAIDLVRRELARRRSQADWAQEASSGPVREADRELPHPLHVQEVSRIFD